jgi:hypothetical protein
MSSPLHVERVGDEVLVTVADDEGTTVVALPIPEGVDEFVEALLREAGMWHE